MKRFGLLLVLGLIGCSVNPGRNPDPVEIEGNVTLAGKKVNNVVLKLLVTGKGLPADIQVKDGKYKHAVTPGKYAYFLSEGSDAAAFAAVPEKYRDSSTERQIEIKSAGTVDIVFD